MTRNNGTTFIENMEPSPYWQQLLLQPSTYAFGIYALLGFLILSVSGFFAFSRHKLIDNLVSLLTKNENAPKYLTVYFKDGKDELPDELQPKNKQQTESMTLLE